MRVLTPHRPLSQVSAKGTRTEVHNAVDMRDLNEYFRREHGMSRRYAREMTREVYRDESTSARLLPSGWHEAIYPPALTYVRPGGSPGALMSEAQHRAWLKAGGDRIS